MLNSPPFSPHRFKTEFTMMTLPTGLIKVTRFTMLLALFSAILSSCSSIKYREMQAASPELKGLKTYHWERPALDAASGANAQQFDATFRAEIDKGMAIKGYVYSAGFLGVSLIGVHQVPMPKYHRIPVANTVFRNLL